MIFIGLYVFIAVILLITDNGRRKRLRFFACICIFAALQTLIGLRHIEYGGMDTIVYARDFERIISQSYSIMDVFGGFYKDFGFYLFAQVFSVIWPDVHAWIFICSLPYTLAVMWLVYHYSEDMFMSFMMFLGLGFYLYDFQLMRHVFALGFIIYSIRFLQENRWKQFLILVLVASSFQITAIFFLAAYPMRNASIGLKQWGALFGGGAMVIFLSQRTILKEVFSILPLLSGERFAGYADVEGGTLANFFIQFLFVLIAWIVLYRRVKIENSQTAAYCGLNRNENFRNLYTLRLHHRTKPAIQPNKIFTVKTVNYHLLLNLAVIGALFYMMQIVIGESYRIAQFFAIFTIILAPNALKRIKVRNLRYLLYVVILFYLVHRFFGGLFLAGSEYNPYVFFWQ